MRRALKIIAGVLVTLVLLVVSAVLVLTRTGFGRERTRRLVLGLLHDKVKGQVEIGRIDGDVLGRFSLVNVRIADSTGHPFFLADRLTARLATGSLLSKRIVFTELFLEKPVIRLEQGMNGLWNYKRIFPPSDSTPTTPSRGFGSWIDLRNVQLTGGTLIVQQPWRPDSALGAHARDSVVAAALAGETRARIERVDGGYRKTMDFQSIDGHFPRVLVADPDTTDIQVRVAQLRMVANAFNPPAIRVADFSGDIRVGADTVAVRQVALRLPGSHATGSITYLLTPGDALLDLRVDTLALADVRGLYPPLPDAGGGSLDLVAAIRTVQPSEYVVRNGHIVLGDTRVDGTVGLVMGTDTTRFEKTDLRFTRFSTALVERLVPGVTLPAHGSVTGRAVLSGPLQGMQVNVDGSFAPLRHPAFHFAARGGAGYDTALLARQLHVRVDALPLSFVKEFAPSIPVGGTLTASATVSGSSVGRMSGRFDATHREQGAVSRVAGEGSVAPGDAMRMDVGLRFLPVSMELAQHFAPKMDLQGDVTGTGHLRGTPKDLTARLDLTLPVGSLAADATYTATGATPAYSATVTMTEVDINAVAPLLPTTTLNGVASVRGEGTDPATLSARVTADLREFVVDSTRFIEAIVAADAASGVVRVDTAHVRTSFGSADADGTFGLAAGHEGKVDYTVTVESLAGLKRWIATRDTSGSVAVRPGVQQRLAAIAARADSVREAGERRRAEEDLAVALAAEAGVGNRRSPRTTVPVIPPIPRDSIAGGFSVTGDVSGELHRFNATGTVATDGILWGGNEIGRGRVAFAYTDARTPQAKLTADAGVDSLRAAGFAFDSTHLKASYANGEGNVEVAIFPGDTAVYRVKADYALQTGAGQLRLQDVQLQLDSATWRSPHPSVVSWKGQGIVVDSLELRSVDGVGRIFVNGEMPDVDPGDLVVAADSVRIAPWLTLLQSDVPANGLVTLHARMQGTQRAPRLRGSLAVEDPTYKGTPFPEVRTTFDYDQRTLTLDGKIARSGGQELATIHGLLPVNLTLGDSTVKTRLIDAPIVLDVKGDSIPLGPLQQLSTAVSAIDGYAVGNFGLRGTWEHPTMVGELGAQLRRFGLAATGVTYTNAAAHVHMAGDTVVVDSLVARSGGTLHGSGTVVVASLANPVLDLSVNANDARVLDDDTGELFANSQIRIVGPLDTLAVTGTARITRGVVYIPDPTNKDVINTGDPAIFAVVDSATAQQLQVVPEKSILDNMSVDIDLGVSRGTWARSHDANIEFYGNLGVDLDPNSKLPVMTGALFTDQGEYTFLSRRFVVSQGSVRFTGEPSLNPVVQVLATYQVRQAGRAPLDIRVIVGGTMEQPKISLESSAQPTLSQSDLISFLAFGRSSGSLLSFQGSGVTGGGSGGSSLAGNVAALATRQLASIALGMMVDKAKESVTTATHADVVNITPADLPADLSLGNLGTILRGTEIELGKYVARQTFLLAQVRPTLAIPGFVVERRYGSRFRLRGTFETRYQPQQPSLTAGLTPETIQVLGALARWSIGW